MLDYYKTAHAASLNYQGHPLLEQLVQLSQSAKRILDYGCGEGTRLNLFASSGGYGVDINPSAIAQAKHQYPRHHFSAVSSNRLPFKANYFDLVYSAFVLEHTTDPFAYLTEALRVTRSGGHLVIVCPNFGSPNRRSPNSTAHPLVKLIKGFWADLFPPTPSFVSVTPQPHYNQIDADTTVEPYLRPLMHFLSHFGSLTYCSSLWPLEAPTSNPRKLLFKYLGQLGLYPFKYWGPQAGVILVKA